MNWKLILQLSLFGLAMGLATITLIPSKVELVCWLIIFIVSAYLIAKNAPGNYFMYGLMTSIFNSFWIIAAHVLWVHTYIANHPEETDMLHKMPMGNHTRGMMIITGLMVGVISGLVLGLFAFIASKMVKKPVAAV